MLHEEEDIAGLKVMVVDDNASVRQIIVEYTNSFGCQTHSSANCMEALDLLEEAALTDRPFNLVLTDIRMPAMDGYEFAAAIRAKPALKDTFIILLTSVGTLGDGEECRRWGVDGCLRKPVKMAELKQSI